MTVSELQNSTHNFTPLYLNGEGATDDKVIIISAEIIHKSPLLSRRVAQEIESGRIAPFTIHFTDISHDRLHRLVYESEKIERFLTNKWCLKPEKKGSPKYHYKLSPSPLYQTKVVL